MNGRVALVVLGRSPAWRTPRAADWPQWRGPARTGIAAGPVTARWPAGSLVRGWSVEVGEGHSGPVVSGGRVYVHARVGGDEVISALDLADGRRVWTHRRRWRTRRPRPRPATAAGPRRRRCCTRGASTPSAPPGS